MKKTCDKRDSDIVTLYRQECLVSDIAKTCQCSIGTVYNVLRRYNVPKHGNIDRTQEHFKNEIANRYQNSQSIHRIQSDMKISPKRIKKILNEYNIPEISYCKRVNPLINEDFFEEIDSEDKAYWIGWIITDGCISAHNMLSLTLQQQDVDILQQLERDLGLTDRISIVNNKYNRLSFCCKKIVNDLGKYGIVMNKTFSVRLPKVEERLIPHLLRGCFEGDGGVCYSKRRGKIENEVNFCGNYECVSDFQRLICKFGVTKNKISKNNSIWRVRWSSKKDLKKIFEVLYCCDNKHRLERKYNRFKNIIENEI